MPAVFILPAMWTSPLSRIARNTERRGSHRPIVVTATDRDSRGAGGGLHHDAGDSADGVGACRTDYSRAMGMGA